VTSDPDFKFHDIFLKSNIIKTARLKDKVTIPNIWNGIMFGDLD